MAANVAAAIPDAADPLEESAEAIESPAKSLNGAADATEKAEEGQVDAPLLRAKQTQAAKGSEPISAVTELDVALISADTVKALFEFMHIEEGEEGERKIDGVLASQSSY